MTPRPGFYLKTPFVWEAGCPVPPPPKRLQFRPAPHDWLETALAHVLATSPDPAEQVAVADHGPHGAATLLLSLSTPHFEQRPGWWQVAISPAAEPVGFVLCSIFPRQGTQPLQGTIFYLGVLPGHRGHRYSRELVDQATLTLTAIGALRILCDTASINTPMIAAFRAAGYREGEPRERPLR